MNIPEYMNDALDGAMRTFNSYSDKKIEKWLEKHVIVLSITNDYVGYEVKRKGKK